MTKRKQYIKSHLDLMDLASNDEVVDHIDKHCKEYLTSLDIAKQYGKYYYQQTCRYSGEVTELVDILTSSNHFQ